MNNKNCCHFAMLPNSPAVSQSGFNEKRKMFEYAET